MKYEEGPLLKASMEVGTFYGPDPSNEIARLREELAEVTALNSRLSEDNDTLRNTLERERHECPGCEQYGHELADMTAERDALVGIANAAREYMRARDEWSTRGRTTDYSTALREYGVLRDALTKWEAK